MQTEEKWFVRNEDGQEFGPCDAKTLAAWARDGRVAPTSAVSRDRVAWTPSVEMPALAYFCKSLPVSAGAWPSMGFPCFFAAAIFRIISGSWLMTPG